MFLIIFVSILLILIVLGIKYRRRLIPRRPVVYHDNRSHKNDPLLDHPSTKHVVHPATGQQYLVTGGIGFLGSHVVDALLARGETRVRILDLFDTGRYAGDPRVEFFAGNLQNEGDCMRACKGVHVVFHTAALIQYWASHDFQIPLHWNVNVIGTQNLLAACHAQGVLKLIQTSTSNVAMTHHEGGERVEEAGEGGVKRVRRAERGIPDVHMMDESAPYMTERPCSPYGLTKAHAEQAVLGANRKDGSALLTCALRPPGIFGERDKLVEATVLEALPLMVMGRMGQQDWVYVENLVHAHFLAERKLAPGSGVDGEAFFITNGEDGYIPGGELYVRVAEAIYRDSFDRARDVLQLPMALLYAIAYPVDWFHRLTRGKYVGTQIAKLTPITIEYVVCNLKFNDAKARKILGYQEIYTMNEGIQRMGIYNRGH